MKFTVVEIYDAEDANMWGEPQTQLIDADGTVILVGDWYHDKIQDRIDAFFITLDYLKLSYTRSEIKQREGE